MNKTTPLLSVVLPVFNQLQFLEQSIRSVLDQDIADLELIIVNDGSTEPVDAVFDLFRSDPRVFVLSQENRGIAHALNQGFSLAKGSLLSWHSADNVFLPGALSRLSAFLRENPDVGLAYSNIQLIDEQGEACRGSNYRVPDQSELDSSILLLPQQTETLKLFNDNFINACFLYRREILELVGQFDSKSKGYEDYVYWLRASCFFKIAHIGDPEPYYQYRLHPESITGRASPDGFSTLQSRAVRRTKDAHEALELPLSVSIVEAGKDFDPIYQALERGLLRSKRLPVRERHRLSLTHGQREPVIRLHSDSADLLTHLVPESLDEMLSAELEVSLLRTDFASPNFLHSTFKEWFATSLEAPFRVSLSGNRERTLWLAPPLVDRKMLRRARDSRFGAVTQSKESKGCFLIFMHDAPHDRESPAHKWAKETLRNLMIQHTGFTYVLLCQHPEQRATADRLVISLENIDHIRIIDVSEQSQEERNASLLYVGGSVDAVLSIKSPQHTLSSTLELRIESLYAALIGRPILSLTHSPEVYCEVASEPERVRKVAARILDEGLHAPHVFAHYLEKLGEEELPQELNRILSQTLAPQTFNAAEGVLDGSRIAQVIMGLLVA